MEAINDAADRGEEGGDAFAETPRQTDTEGADGLAGQEALAILDDVPGLLEFVRRYPDVLEFPEAVAERIRQGDSPLEAYRDYENADLRSRLCALEQNAANEKTAMGSARGAAGGEEGPDDLMSLFKTVFK